MGMTVNAEDVAEPTEDDTDDMPEAEAVEAPIIEVGADEQVYGTVTVAEGKFVFDGPNPEQVEYYVRFYAEKFAENADDEESITPEAILQYMDDRMNGRVWARPYEAPEAEQVDDDGDTDAPAAPEGGLQGTDGERVQGKPVGVG